MQQHFGKIELNPGQMVDAMICIDSDLPSEMMMHWWGESPEALGAVRARLNKIGPHSYELIPQQLFRSNPNPKAIGGLWPPAMSAEEFSKFKSLRATLREGRKVISGSWAEPGSKKKRRFKFERESEPMKLDALRCENWTEFKAWAADSRQTHGAMLFRGHGDSTYRLSTTLHRMGRTRLERYCIDVLPKFRAEAEAILDQKINLDDGDDYAMVLGLAQHHGLPTPLLDWTRSAYVAAFFAFSDVIEKSSSSQPSHVRVYALSKEFVDRTTPSVITVPFILPYVSALSVSPRRNPRLSAQQGEFLVTNIADLEGFLCRTYPKGTLIAADIPASCAIEALEDLAFMGLSAATMFPGLDGLCRNLKHQMLFKRALPPTTSKANEAQHSDLDVAVVPVPGAKNT